MLKQEEGLRDTKAEAKVTGREAESKPYVVRPYVVRPYTASISQCFMIKHYKNIEERDTLLFTILFNKKYHTASFCHFLCQNII